MVGAKLRAWRDRHGKLSTRDAAKAAGVSQPVWLALENGDGKRIGLSVAKKIVDLLAGDLTLDEIAAEEQGRRPKRRRRSATSRRAA